MVEKGRDHERDPTPGAGTAAPAVARGHMRIGDIVGPGFVYQTESTILRVEVRTPRVDDGFMTARRRARQWLQDVCSRHGLAIEPGNDVAVANERAGLDLVVRPQRLVAALRHADERFPERTWHVNVDLGCENGGDVAVCNLRFRAEHPSDARPIEPYAGRLVGVLCDGPGLEDVQRMRTGAPSLRPADVATLVQLVAARARRFPVILVSQPLLLNVGTLARDLAGLAHVFVLDEDASWEISHRYDRRYSAYLGAVKIYLRGVTFGSPPSEAPLYQPQMLQILARNGEAESTLRRSVLADLTVQFESAPLLTPADLRVQEEQATVQRQPRVEIGLPVIAVDTEPIGELHEGEGEAQRLRQELAAARQAAAAARQEAAAARKEAADYWHEYLAESAEKERLQAELEQLRETELGLSVEELSPSRRDLVRTIFTSVGQVREALLENDDLRRQLEGLRSEHEGLRARLARTYERLDQESTAVPLQPLPRPAWDDFDALQTWAETQYGGRLVFHPRVRDRLGDGNPQDVDVLFDILDVLGTDYAAMKRGAESAYDRFRERTKGYKAGKALTPIGAGFTGDDYACVFDGVRYAAEDHQHIRERGTSFTGRTVCIYFVYDDANERVVVTSMPRHLETVSGRT